MQTEGETTLTSALDSTGAVGPVGTSLVVAIDDSVVIHSCA